MVRAPGSANAGGTPFEWHLPPNKRAGLHSRPPHPLRKFGCSGLAEIYTELLTSLQAEADGVLREQFYPEANCGAIRTVGYGPSPRRHLFR